MINKDEKSTFHDDVNVAACSSKHSKRYRISADIASQDTKSVRFNDDYTEELDSHDVWFPK
jgi:hypothetical protein